MRQGVARWAPVVPAHLPARPRAVATRATAFGRAGARVTITGLPQRPADGSPWLGRPRRCRWRPIPAQPDVCRSSWQPRWTRQQSRRGSRRATRPGSTHRTWQSASAGERRRIEDPLPRSLLESEMGERGWSNRQWRQARGPPVATRIWALPGVWADGRAQPSKRAAMPSPPRGASHARGLVGTYPASRCLMQPPAPTLWLTGSRSTPQQVRQRPPPGRRCRSSPAGADRAARATRTALGGGRLRDALVLQPHLRA